MEELKLMACVAGIVLGPKAMTALLVEIRHLYLAVFMTLVTDPQKLAIAMSLLSIGRNEPSNALPESSSTALVKRSRPRGPNAKGR